jgi:hypothetical protein
LSKRYFGCGPEGKKQYKADRDVGSHASRKPYWNKVDWHGCIAHILGGCELFKEKDKVDRDHNGIDQRKRKCIEAVFEIFVFVRDDHVLSSIDSFDCSMPRK